MQFFLKGLTIGATQGTKVILMQNFLKQSRSSARKVKKLRRKGQPKKNRQLMKMEQREEGQQQKSGGQRH